MPVGYRPWPSWVSSLDFLVFWGVSSRLPVGVVGALVLFLLSQVAVLSLFLFLFGFPSWVVPWRWFPGATVRRWGGAALGGSPVLESLTELSGSCFPCGCARYPVITFVSKQSGLRLQQHQLPAPSRRTAGRQRGEGGHVARRQVNPPQQPCVPYEQRALVAGGQLQRQQAGHAAETRNAARAI